jgi:hypothetical protein
MRVLEAAGKPHTQAGTVASVGATLRAQLEKSGVGFQAATPIAVQAPGATSEAIRVRRRQGGHRRGRVPAMAVLARGQRDRSQLIRPVHQLLAPIGVPARQREATSVDVGVRQSLAERFR